MKSRWTILAATIAMLAALVAFGGIAAAAPADCTITGTRASEFLPGTPDPDVICALGGDDGVQARESNDKVYGNGGNDSIDGNQGDDLELGGNGNDQLGNICFSNNPSVECYITIPAEQIVDVGSDTFKGADGDDQISASDWHFTPTGELVAPFKDTVNCGPGIDTVYHDSSDVVAKNCETKILDDPPVTTTTLRSASQAPEAAVFQAP